MSGFLGNLDANGLYTCLLSCLEPEEKKICGNNLYHQFHSNFPRCLAGCGELLPENEAKECEERLSHRVDAFRYFYMSEKNRDTPTPPSEPTHQDLKPTRLEKIRERFKEEDKHPDVSVWHDNIGYLLSKLDTAVDVLDEIAKSLGANYEEGWMANEVAAEALKSIKEDE